MLSYLETFFNEFDFPQDSREFLTDAYVQLAKNDKANKFLTQAAETYRKDFNCDYLDMLENCKLIAEETAIHEYTVSLLLYICLTKYSKKHYEKHGYSEELWHNTFVDLRYKLIECKLIKGIHGTFVARWISGFFALTRFGFKRLQFEISEAKRDYKYANKEIKANDPVINVHIPRTGTPLTPAEVEKDFKAAAEFFKDSFKNSPVAFACHSWLLFEKLKDFLNAKSNIVAFMNKFDIIFTDYLEAGNYNQVWRLFDVDYKDSLDNLPEDTSLRRAYKQYLKDGGKWGAGYGIFFA